MHLNFRKDKIYPREQEQEDQPVSYLEKDITLLISLCSQVFFHQKRNSQEEALVIVFLSDVALP